MKRREIEREGGEREIEREREREGEREGGREGERERERERESMCIYWSTLVYGELNPDY